MLIIKNAKIVTVSSETIENGMILINDGKFISIGNDLEIPLGAEIIDVQGNIITPGLIDVHTHLGVNEEGGGRDGHDFNEVSSEVTPEVRALDGILPSDKGFEDARNSGVTTVQVMPGSANIIGGEMVVLKTIGNVVDQMVIKNPSGLKAATGENPKKFHGEKGRAGSTRMGVAGRLREKLIEGLNYIDKSESDSFERNLGLENIAKVLRKEIPLRVHAHRADDIATALRIKREFNIDMTIEHCTEGHKISSFIAEHGVMVSVGPTMSTRSKQELKDKGWNTLVELVKEGVQISITTDHPVVSIEHLRTSAILAVKNGLSEKVALEAITLNSAKHIGVADRVGSIEEGKDADFVIWSGDPFDLRSSVQFTFINGKCVYRSN